MQKTLLGQRFARCGFILYTANNPGLVIVSSWGTCGHLRSFKKFLPNSEPLGLRAPYIRPQPARTDMRASGERLNWALSRNSLTTGKQCQRAELKRRPRPDEGTVGASRQLYPQPVKTVMDSAHSRA
jgi:hypothetical protein